MSEERLIWIDCETTGLDPCKDCILEVGCIVTDKELNEIARMSEVITCNLPTLQNMKEEVIAMHRASGLWDECLFATRYLDDIADDLAAFIKKHGGQHPMAGSTIGFDRAFFYFDAPQVLDACHYRSVDVSSLKVLAGLWGYPPAVKSREAKHRALPDIEDSIEELRHYRRTMLREVLP